MGYYEALEDHIQRSETGDGYYVPCHICGESIFSYSYIRGTKYTCKDCKRYLAEVQCKLNNKSVKKKRFENAISRIKKVANIEDYADAIRIVGKKLDTPGWFQSTEEIMVAMELIKRKIKAHHQVKIYSYSVDFVLPDLKVVLEIDGPMHRLTRRQSDEEIRDELIINALGEDYDVIRIRTEEINTNVTKLLKAIKSVKHYRDKQKKPKMSV